MVALVLIAVTVLIAVSVTIAHNVIIPTPAPMAFALLMGITIPQMIWCLANLKLYNTLFVRVLSVLNIGILGIFLVLNLIYSIGVDFFGLSAFASIPIAVLGILLSLGLLVAMILSRTTEVAVRIVGILMVLSLVFLYVQPLFIPVQMYKTFGGSSDSSLSASMSDSTQSDTPTASLSPEQKLDQEKWNMITHNYSSLQTDIAPRIRNCEVTQIKIMNIPSILESDYILIWGLSPDEDAYLPISDLQETRKIYDNATAASACKDKPLDQWTLWSDARVNASQ